MMVYVSDKCDTTKVEQGSYPMVFMSPESLLFNHKWKDMLYHLFTSQT